MARHAVLRVSSCIGIVWTVFCHSCVVTGYTTPDQRNFVDLAPFHALSLFELPTKLTSSRAAAVAAALKFRDEMVEVGPNWANALKSWQCPTPPALSNGSCDPCGVNVWWVLLAPLADHKQNLTIYRPDMFPLSVPNL